MTGMGRPRSNGNSDFPRYFHKDQGGYYVINPLNNKKARLGSDKARALQLFDHIRTLWEGEQVKQQAAAIVNRVAKLSNTPTLASYATTWQADILPTHRKRSGDPIGAKTRQDYQRLSGKIAEHAPFALPINRIELPTLRQFLNQWRTAPSYHNQLLAVLSLIYQSAIDAGITNINPLREIRRKPAPKRTEHIDQDAYLQITAHLEPWQQRACDLVYLISHRPADVLALIDKDITINPDRQTVIKFQAAKNDQPMEITGGNELAEIVEFFREWKARQRLVSPYLIVYPTSTYNSRHIGKPVSRDWLSRIWSAARKKAGYEHYQIRDLRKTALTDEAIIAGEATNKGGHQTEQMRRYYVIGQLPVRATNNLVVLRDRPAKSQ